MSFLNLNREPLPTDWGNIHNLLQDMKAFAKTNPKHKFLCADDPGFGQNPRVPRLGWVAFLEDAEDEQQKMWTIPLEKVQGMDLLKLGPSYRTPWGRQQMLKALVDEARSV